ncbi:MAG: DUF1573 domain-containing protein [Ignavibacteria bacterium]|jgi:hypothetical protein|nr:DUF1573 domain-containing protein [Ignavibacteria bacterium]
MKTQTILFLILAICSINLLAQPKINVPNTNVDFGKQSYQNTPQKTTIIIKNTGTDTLHIEDVRPGCGCTVADANYKKNLATGDSTTVGVTLDIKNFSGKVSKHLDIKSNDQDAPSYRVMLNVDVQRPFELRPKYLSFDRVFVDEQSDAEINIVNTSGSDAVVKSVTSDNAAITVNLKKDDVLKKGESYKLVATALTDKRGSLRSKITIELFHADENKLEVLVYGNAINKE